MKIWPKVASSDLIENIVNPNAALIRGNKFHVHGNNYIMST